jgi:hypothetical protein
MFPVCLVCRPLEAKPERRFLSGALMVMAACAWIAVSPSKFFRMLNWGRPLPKLIENRWVLIFYRVTAVAILIWVVKDAVRVFHNVGASLPHPEKWEGSQKVTFRGRARKALRSATCEPQIMAAKALGVCYNQDTWTRRFANIPGSPLWTRSRRRNIAIGKVGPCMSGLNGFRTHPSHVRDEWYGPECTPTSKNSRPFARLPR